MVYNVIEYGKQQVHYPIHRHNSLEVLPRYSGIKLYNNFPKKIESIKCNQSYKVQVQISDLFM